MAIGEGIFWLCFVDLKDIHRLMDMGLWRRTWEMSILGWSMVVTRIGNGLRPDGRRRKRKKGGGVDWFSCHFNRYWFLISASALQSLIFLSFPLFCFCFRFLLTRTSHYKRLHMHLYYSNSTLFFCVHNFVDDNLDFSGLFGLILLLLVFGVVKHIYTLKYHY